MAVDPKKLKNFVDGKSDPSVVDIEEDLDESTEDGEGGEGGRDKYMQLMPLLEEFAPELIEMSDEMDADVLTDLGTSLESDDEMILKQGYEVLDRRLKKEMAACCAGISEGDAAYLANYLADEGMVSEPDRLAGYIYRIGQMLAQESGEPSEEEAMPGDDLPADEAEEAMA